MYDVAERWEIATLRRYCKGEICADFEQQVGGAFSPAFGALRD